MLTAIYYPHMEIRDERLIKSALLLWDHVEYIAPYYGFKPWHSEPDLDAALRLISSPHVPSPKEKKLAHDAILELASRRLPQWFFIDRVRSRLKYGLYAEKFLPDTWEQLRRKRLALPKSRRGFLDYEATLPLGLAMMSILADCCAGSTGRLVTDEVASYAALTRYLTEIAGGDYGRFDAEHERLVTISLRLVDTDSISIRRLIDLRERESRPGGGNLRALRHRYLKAVDRCSERLAKEARHAHDRKEISRTFEQEMRDDLEALRDELKIEAKKALLSKEVLVAVLAATGTFVEPVTNSLIGIGALLKKKVEYRAARNRTLQGHPMSWLYVAQKRALL